MAFTCASENTKIVWSDNLKEKILTGAVKVKVESGLGNDKKIVEERVLANSPVVPTVTGFLGAHVWLKDLVSDYSESKAENASIDSSPPLSSARQLLGGNADVIGTYIVYTGVEQVLASLTIMCSSPADQVRGRMQTWTGITDGVVACGNVPPTGSFGELAKRHC